MRHRVTTSLLLALALASGCQLVPSPATVSGLKRPTSASKDAKPAYAAEGEKRAVPRGEATAAVTVTGQVLMIADRSGTLISDKGAGLISDKGAGIVGNNAAGVISNNSGSIVSNNGGSLIGKVKYGVLATEPALAQYRLADARLEVLDAQGRMLTDDTGAPIGAVSDREGNFRFEAPLPDENLVLRIRLFNGGTLLAMLPRDGGDRELAINTASSLGAAYVLNRYVQARQAVYDRLPAKEADALHAEIMDAYAQLPVRSATYRPADMVEAAEAMRRNAAKVDAAFERIEAILLAGQKNAGDGLNATEIALATPTGAVFGPDGTLYVGEWITGRVRVVKVGGLVSTLATTGFVTDMAIGPDGALYLPDRLASRVRRIGLDGTVSVVAGNGERAQGALAVPATQAPLEMPMCLAFEPDGGMLIGERPTSVVDPGRLLRVGRDGVIVQIEAPWKPGAIAGVAASRAGDVYALLERGEIWHRPPGAAWKQLAADLKLDIESRMALAPDGRLYVSETRAHRVIAVAPDGRAVPVAGTGASGAGGDGGPATEAALSLPAGLSFTADGTLVIADKGAGLVRTVDAQGVIRTVAGTRGASQEGDALVLPLNTPTGITVDAQGRVVIAESGSGTIKRLENGRLTTLAGTTVGFSGDGGPALAAQFDSLTGLAYHGDTLYALSGDKPRLRRIDAAGLVTTVAGTGERGPLTGGVPDSGPALAPIMRRPMVLTIDPSGRPVWTDNENGHVLRLEPDGTVTRLAGVSTPDRDSNPLLSPPRQNVPATTEVLRLPSGLAYDSQGHLYVADTANLVIRKIAPDGTITTAYGSGVMGAMALLGKYTPGQDDDKPAKDAVLIAPSGLLIAPDGTMYVGEAGTAHLSKLGSFQGLSAEALGVAPFGARIRKIAPDGTITTLAGPGGKTLTEPGQLGLPTGLALDGQGRLLVVDSLNHQLLAIPKSAL